MHIYQTTPARVNVFWASWSHFFTHPLVQLQHMLSLAVPVILYAFLTPPLFSPAMSELLYLVAGACNSSVRSYILNQQLTTIFVVPIGTIMDNYARPEMSYGWHGRGGHLFFVPAPPRSSLFSLRGKCWRFILHFGSADVSGTWLSTTVAQLCVLSNKEFDPQGKVASVHLCVISKHVVCLLVNEANYTYLIKFNFSPYPDTNDIKYVILPRLLTIHPLSLIKRFFVHQCEYQSHTIVFFLTHI